MSNDTNKSKQTYNFCSALKNSECTYSIMSFQQIIACYTMLCMFDNARDKLSDILKDSPSHGELFDPQFFCKSVIIPCYLIGVYMAKIVTFDSTMKKKEDDLMYHNNSRNHYPASVRYGRRLFWSSLMIML